MNDETDSPVAHPLETLAAGKYLKLVKQGHWEWASRVQASGAVCIVAVTDDRKIIFVEQYRPPVGCNVIELPAGLAGDIAEEADEKLEAAARRELLEETGYLADNWQQLGTHPSSPGMSDETTTFFIADDLRKESAGGGVDSEKILVHKIELDQIDSWLKSQTDAGKLVDTKTYAGLYFFRPLS